MFLITEKGFLQNWAVLYPLQNKAPGKTYVQFRSIILFPKSNQGFNIEGGGHITPGVFPSYSSVMLFFIKRVNVTILGHKINLRDLNLWGQHWIVGGSSVSLLSLIHR